MKFKDIRILYNYSEPLFDSISDIEIHEFSMENDTLKKTNIYIKSFPVILATVFLKNGRNGI